MPSSAPDNIYKTVFRSLTAISAHKDKFIFKLVTS
jgi:hypothetical protein